MNHFGLFVLAALDYPSAPVMMLATLVMIAFIFGGGYYFRKAGARDLAERRAFRAKALEKLEDKKKDES